NVAPCCAVWRDQPDRRRLFSGSFCPGGNTGSSASSDHSTGQPFPFALHHTRLAATRVNYNPPSQTIVEGDALMRTMDGSVPVILMALCLHANAGAREPAPANAPTLAEVHKIWDA